MQELKLAVKKVEDEDAAVDEEDEVVLYQDEKVYEGRRHPAED